MFSLLLYMELTGQSHWCGDREIQIRRSSCAQIVKAALCTTTHQSTNSTTEIRGENTDLTPLFLFLPFDLIVLQILNPVFLWEFIEKNTTRSFIKRERRKGLDSPLSDRGKGSGNYVLNSDKKERKFLVCWRQDLASYLPLKCWCYRRLLYNSICNMQREKNCKWVFTSKNSATQFSLLHTRSAFYYKQHISWHSGTEKLYFLLLFNFFHL